MLDCQSLEFIANFTQSILSKVKLLVTTRFELEVTEQVIVRLIFFFN